jgi:hypothetical protein
LLTEAHEKPKTEKADLNFQPGLLSFTPRKHADTTRRKAAGPCREENKVSDAKPGRVFAARSQVASEDTSEAYPTRSPDAQKGAKQGGLCYGLFLF